MVKDKKDNHYTEGQQGMADVANKLADAHWNYMATVLEARGVGDQEIWVAETHYKTAFVHGYKHGVADAKEQYSAMQKLMK